MKYTLYIDESGDFESQKGQWIISGVLISASYEECEEKLNTIFSNMPSELGLKSIRNFHLTEFRREKTHPEATLMARSTLSKLNNKNFPDYHFLACINHSKTSMSVKEKTYRLMLLDLLALCETVIPENESIDKLDLIVATRTIDGILQTKISDLQADVINALPSALEVDLASRGIVDLIGKHIKVYMDYANNSWGLVCADFVANLTYHNRKEAEIEYFKELQAKEKYTLFESFGDFASRRANVAERDKDYVLALYRWLLIYEENSKNENADNTIKRLLSKIFYKRGTTGSKTSFEALIERLWRTFNKPEKYVTLLSILSLLDKTLVDFFDQNNVHDSKQYLFRLRNVILIIQNHLGDTKNAYLICQKQKEMTNHLASNPEHFQMILDYKSIEIEVYINDLDFVVADMLAEKYKKTIENYKEIWTLLVDDNVEFFETSRAAIKADMIQIRSKLLNIDEPNNIDDSLLTIFEQLENRLTNINDLSRFANYKTMLELKYTQPKKAIEKYFSFIEARDLDIFEFFWFLRSVNDGLLDNQMLNLPKIKKIISDQLSFFDLNKVGHPYDLLLRELGLFEFLTGDKSQALKYIKKSKNAFNLENSNIAMWLSEMLRIHEDVINGKLKEMHEYFVQLNQTDIVKKVYKPGKDLLIRVRYYSPY